MAISRFGRRSTFKCGVCTRLTRDVGDNGGCELCPQCFILAGIENEISDGYCTLAERIEVIRKTVAEIQAKGGDVIDWKETFSL
jgi:hypothetical protein